MSQNTLDPYLAHYDSLSLDNTDWGLRFSTDMPLLVEPDRGNLEAAARVAEGANNRKRKPEDGEVGDGDIEAERQASVGSIDKLLDEAKTHSRECLARIARESKTARDATITPYPPVENDVGAPKPVGLGTLSDNTLPLSMPPIQAQHFCLARVPNSAPLSRRTIQKAGELFTKLLIDGNEIDMIEIHEKLGLRLFQVEEGARYRHLQNEVAAKNARRQALGVVDVRAAEDPDNEDDGVNVFEIGRDGQRERRQGPAAGVGRTRQPKADAKKVSKPSRKRTRKPGAAASAASLTSSSTTAIPNSNEGFARYLQQQQSNRNLYNASPYAAYGSSETEEARRSLEENHWETPDDVMGGCQ